MIKINSRIAGFSVRTIAFPAPAAAMGVALMVGAATLAGCGDAGAAITRLTVGTPGPDPYTAATGTDQRRIARRKHAGGTRDGDTPGLYGGTRRVASCDPRRLVRFLRTDPGKAGAWAGAHGIAPAAIAGFVSRLTPVLLRTDTLVTNHGFRDGRATGAPAVLQAGTGVLVNDYGIPTVKCNCGNPLTAPKKGISTGNARYTGTSWNGFSDRTVTRIRRHEGRTGAISSFVLVDPGATMGFARPRATTGGADGPATAPPPEDAATRGGSPAPGDPSAAPPSDARTGVPLPDGSGGVPTSPGAPADGTGGTGGPGGPGTPPGPGGTTPPSDQATPPPAHPSAKPALPGEPPGAGPGAAARPAAPVSEPARPRSPRRSHRDGSRSWPD